MPEAVSSEGLKSPEIGAGQSAILKRVHEHCLNFRNPILHRSIGQLFVALSIYLALAGAMILSARNGMPWLVALIALPAAGMLVKLFIIQHDCGHGSFFRSRTFNMLLGWVISILTLTPYAYWRDAHNRHHASSGDLDARGLGAIDTLTVDEFKALPPARQKLYKLYRHPMIMILIGPFLHIMIFQRMTNKGPMPFMENYQTISGSHLWRSIMALNLAIVLFYGTMIAFLGWQVVAMVFLPIWWISAAIGGWLFYVQHQYEGAYWEHSENWDFRAAALHGSSHYDLPGILHWFTGNIGFHHIHHLSAMIPNYRLRECHEKCADLMTFPKMSIRESFRTARLRVWNPATKSMEAV